MKTKEPIGVLPLNEEEKNFLKYIYTRRLRSLSGIVPGIAIVNIYLRVKSESWIGPILLIPIELAILTGAICMYFKRIHSVWIDYRRGVKEAVSFHIIRKEYMEYTGQYFVALDSPEHLFHETDRSIWEQCEPGDTFILYRTPKAKYYFNSQGRFELL